MQLKSKTKTILLKYIGLVCWKCNKDFLFNIIGQNFLLCVWEVVWDKYLKPLLSLKFYTNLFY